MHACKNNITSPPDCVEGATAQIKKNLLLPPMHNGLAVEDLCSVPDLHFDPLQMGREPALSASLSPHARPWAGPTSWHPIAQSGRLLTPRNEDLEVPVRRWNLEGCRLQSVRFISHVFAAAPVASRKCCFVHAWSRSLEACPPVRRPQGVRTGSLLCTTTAALRCRVCGASHDGDGAAVELHSSCLVHW